MNLINLFFVSALTNNIVLTKFLGICPFIGTTSKEKNALGMGISVTLVITLSSFITYLIYHYLLLKTDTIYLKTIIFILIIASLVQLTEMLLKKYDRKLHESLGIYLPLITTNCAVLGVCLLNINNDYSLIESLVFSLGSGIGFIFVSYIFASMRKRIDKAPVINCFKGYPIALITASIMVLLFARYI